MTAPSRPSAFVLEDNAFWFDAARQRRLVVQECAGCGRLRHPPSPWCPECRSGDWRERECRGTGAVHSYVVSHHPRHEFFTYPLPVVLVDLDEGTRLVAGYGADPDDLAIGQRVAVSWVVDVDGGTWPVFLPAEEPS